MNQEERPRILLGSVVALLGTLGFAPITTLARLAYDAGANPETLVLARYLVASLVFAVFLTLAGRSLRLPRRLWGNALAAGLCWIAGTYGYLASVAYIPVGLAAVTIYCFPLIVAALAPLTEGSRLDWTHGLAFVAAFLGLALALGPSFDSLDWRGLALAFAGALGTAGMLLLTGRLPPEADGLAHTFWINFIGLLGLALAVALGGGPRLPVGGDGWLAFGAVLAVYVLAIVCILGGAKMAGAARTAMIMNLEPVLTLLLASFVLHEVLQGRQVVGAALVLGAVVLVGWLDLRRAR